MSQVATTLKVKLAVILVEMLAQVDYYNCHRLYFLNCILTSTLVLGCSNCGIFGILAYNYDVSIFLPISME